MAIPFKIKILLWRDRFFGKSYVGMPAQEARNYASTFIQRVADKIDFPALEMHRVKNSKIPMRDNYNIGIRIYTPTSEKNLPILVYYHGGGFVIYDLDSHDRLCRRLAKTSNIIVVSVDYRLSPEHKFPTPAHDCYDALKWVESNATTFGGDPNLISVGGDSAGGNLATATCIQSRDGGGPRIRSQVLIYPTVDGTMHFPSIDKNGKGYLLTKSTMQWFVNHYAREEKDKIDPLFSPIFQEDLVGLPPAFVYTAQFDPLHDEGAAYAQKLKDAGVHTKYMSYPGMVHGFMNMPKLAKSALDAHDQIHSFLKEVGAA